MSERDNLIRILRTRIWPKEGADPAEVVADLLLDNGVRFATVDAVPLSELTALRDTLYDMDAITFRGLSKLNQLISKYGGNGMSNTIPIERRWLETV